jgi:hypothetical protein
MARYQITCIRKSGGYALEHITDVGCGSVRFTRIQVVVNIEAGSDQYFVKDPYTGQTAEVRVWKEYYIRTTPDGDLNDNLLSLPTCS